MEHPLRCCHALWHALRSAGGGALRQGVIIRLRCCCLTTMDTRLTPTAMRGRFEPLPSDDFFFPKTLRSANGRALRSKGGGGQGLWANGKSGGALVPMLGMLWGLGTSTCLQMSRPQWCTIVLLMWRLTWAIPLVAPYRTM